MCVNIVIVRADGEVIALAVEGNGDDIAVVKQLEELLGGDVQIEVAVLEHIVAVGHQRDRGRLKLPSGGDGRGNGLCVADVVGQEVAGLALILALDHIELRRIDDTVGIVLLELAAVCVQPFNVVAAAVVAVVVDDNGKGLVSGDFLAVVGHGNDALTFGLRVVDDIREAFAVDHVVVGQVAGVDRRLAVNDLDLGSGKLEPLVDFLALHGDLIEPVFKAIELEHIAKVDVALVDDVGVIAGGQRCGDRKLRGLIVGLVVRGVLAGVVVSAPELNGVDEVHERRRLRAKLLCSEVRGSFADLLEHVLVPSSVLVRLQDLHEFLVQLVVFHVNDRGGNGGLAGLDVVGDLDLRDRAGLGERLENMDVLALGVLKGPVLVVVLVAGESERDGVGLLDQFFNEVGLDVAVDAAVSDDNDHVGLFLHFRLILLVGFDNVGKIDAFPVCGDIPSRDVRVAEADDRDLYAVKVLDDVGIIASPCRPVLAFVAVGRGIEVVGQADGNLLLRFGRGGGRVVELAAEDVQTVVELMVADDPHIVADGTEGLDGRIVGLGLIERIIIGQRSALNGIAHIDDIQVVAVFRALLLDVGGNTGQAALVGSALRNIDRIIRSEDLAVQVGGHKELKIGSFRNIDAALSRAVVGFLDDTAELLGDIVDDDGIQRIAGVELRGRRCEGVVGIAAAGNEVVGDNGVLRVLIKGLSVDLVDGHALNGSGTVVGRVRISLGVLVVFLCSVDGDLHTGDLREAADCLRGAVGRSFQRLEQLRAGHIDDRDGVAEGQDGEDIVLGHVAGLDRSADAAAVGDGHDVVRIDLGDGAGILLGEAPDHRVGDKVAVIGFLGAVARRLCAVQLDLGGGEFHAVFGFDIVDDLLCFRQDRLVLIVEAFLAGLDKVVLLDLLRGVVNDDYADVGKFRAGGLDGLVVLALFHDRMRVCVNDEVQTRDLFVKVIGTVRLGGSVHAEVGQADDEVRSVGLQRVDLSLRVLPDRGIGRVRQEGQSLDQRGIRLRLRLGRFQAEEADLHAALFDNGIRLKDGSALGVEHVGAEDREVRLLHVFLKLREAVVELMVAEAGDIVACGVHQLDGVRALAQGNGSLALTVVAGIGQNNVGACGLQFGFQRGYIGVAQNLAVDVIRMENDGFSRRDLRDISCVHGRQQREDHAQHQQEGQNAR